MALTHTILRGYTDSSGVLISQSETASSDGEVNYEGTLTGANQEVDIAFTQDNMKSLLLYASAACTIYTNDVSGGAPQDTIAMAAGQARVWTYVGDGDAKNPFSNDVTKLYVTVPSGNATLKVRAIVDVTP